MKKIVIFGESHTRSFAYIENLIPVFMDSGRRINLDNKNIKNVRSKIKTLKDNLPDGDYIFFTFLGEPNVRYQLDNDWDIHKNTKFKVNDKIDKRYLDQCVKNYKELFDDLGIISYVITPTTAYQPSIKSLIYFNEKLKEVFNDKVIDIFSTTLVDGTIKDSFKDPNFENDPIHLNSKIVDEFFNQLVLKNVINKEEIDYFTKNKELVYANHIKDIFQKNRFGTFNLK
jgi:hypothetical protein